MSCQLQIYSMMAKRTYDDVEEEDSISDDLLNQHYDELENNSMVGKYLTINPINCMINQTNSNWMPSIQTWVWNNLVVLSLTLTFKMLDSEKIGKRQRINKDMRPPSSRHELHPMAILSEKKLKMRQRGKNLKNVLKKSFRGQTLIEIYFAGLELGGGLLAKYQQILSFGQWILSSASHLGQLIFASINNLSLQTFSKFFHFNNWHEIKKEK